MIIVKRPYLSVLFIYSVLLILCTGCTPKVEIELPDKPIEININAKIDHEVRIKVERDVEKLLDSQKDLF